MVKLAAVSLQRKTVKLAATVKRTVKIVAILLQQKMVKLAAISLQRKTITVAATVKNGQVSRNFAAGIKGQVSSISTKRSSK